VPTKHFLTVNYLKQFLSQQKKKEFKANRKWTSFLQIGSNLKIHTVCT
jgi:hypothetical protein